VAIEQNLRQTLSQRIDPKLIMANSILQLGVLELQQAIEQELEENPAIEKPDDDPCQNCEQPAGSCSDCQFRKTTVYSDTPDLQLADFEHGVDFAADRDDPESDFLSNISAQVSMQDHLLSSLRAAVPVDQFQIGEHIVSSINDSGYFEGTVEDIALDLGKDPSEIESVLAIIQTLDPPGIAARDIRECLRIQLERLAEEGAGNAVALAMVRNYWDDMLAGRFGRIARRLHVSSKDVANAVEFVRVRLNPYPGSCFRPPFVGQAAADSATLTPDAIVRRTAGGYEVEVVGYDQISLAISPKYLALYDEMRRNPEGKYSKEEREHVFGMVERADLFIRSLNERRRTLRDITRAVVEYQQGYVETGSQGFLRPLTRTTVAGILGIHQSTVSRATANKFVQLPSEEIIPYDHLFGGSTNVKTLIKDLIDNEDKTDPLSDQAIADILNQQGYDVARRTVVKYREAQRILSSRKRRQ